MKKPQFQSLPLLLFSLLILLFSLVIVDGARLGGWTPANPEDPHVVEIGKFAVDAHNKEAKTDLKFDRVVKAETQVVSGVNYRITLSATTGGGAAAKNYEAVVWEKAWEKFVRLTSFRPV